MRNDALLLPRSKSPVEAKFRDLDLPDYFLIRRTPADSDGVCPRFGQSKASSDQKSSKSKPQKSGWSSRESLTKGKSISTAQSMLEKNQAIQNSNDKSIGVISPCSAGSSSSHSIDPPRPPRVGCEWVWFPEGYWAEREIRLPTKSASRLRWWGPSRDSKSRRSIITELSVRGLRPTDKSTINIESLLSRKSSATNAPKIGHLTPTSRTSNATRTHSMKDDFGLQSKKPVPVYHGKSPEEPHPGLYRRVKKTVRSRFLQKATTIDESAIVDGKRLISRTTLLLLGTFQCLDRAEQQTCRNSAPHLTPEAPQTPDSSSLSSFRRFGLGPWHRRSSHESIVSASSSVFKLLLGKPPATTPNPDHKYEGTDERTYLKVDIASPEPIGPTFLPSEAKRVNTPPMFPGTPELQPRGFFFDLNPRRKDSTSPVSISSNAVIKNRSSGTSPSIEWWEADTQHASTGNKSARLLNMHKNMDEVTAISQTPRTPFELNLPEHLPNSPLCPKDPMHDSGGAGICPYHGRRRSDHLMNVIQSGSRETSSMPSGRTARRRRQGQIGRIIGDGREEKGREEREVEIEVP